MEAAIFRGPRTILVVGATGAHGGSVARHLLARGFAVRALTRHPFSEGSAALLAEGAEPVAGDLDHRPSLRAALAGCWGAFGMVPAESSADRAQRGRNLVHAVAGSELEHFVLAPPAPVDETGLEAYARSLGLPATYLSLSGADPDALGATVTGIFERPGPFVGRALALPLDPPLHVFPEDLEGHGAVGEDGRVETTDVEALP